MKAKGLVCALTIMTFPLGVTFIAHNSKNVIANNIPPHQHTASLADQSSALGQFRNQNINSYALSWQDAEPVSGTNTRDPAGDVLMIGGTTQGPSADGGEAMWTLTLQDGPVNQVQITLWTNGERWGKGIHSLGQDGTVSLYLDDQLVHTIVCDTLGEFSNYWPANAPAGSPAYVTNTITLAEPVGPDLTFRIVAEPGTAIDINQVEIETAIVPPPPTPAGLTGTPSASVSYELSWQDAEPVSGTNTLDIAGDVLIVGGTTAGPSPSGSEAMWTLTLQDGPVNQVQITLWTNGELYWGKGIHSLGQDGTVSLYINDQLVHTIVCDTLGEFNNYWPASAPVGSPTYATGTITLAEPVGPDLTFWVIASPGTVININRIEIETATFPLLPVPTPTGTSSLAGTDTPTSTHTRTPSATPTSTPSSTSTYPPTTTTPTGTSTPSPTFEPTFSPSPVRTGIGPSDTPDVEATINEKVNQTLTEIAANWTPTPTHTRTAIPSRTPPASSTPTITPNATQTSWASTATSLAQYYDMQGTQIARTAVAMTAGLVEESEFEVIDQSGEIIGTGTVRLYAPHEVKLAERVAIRFEVEVDSPLASNAQDVVPVSGPSLEITYQDTSHPLPTAVPLAAEGTLPKVYEYMGAGLGGIDLNQFQVDGEIKSIQRMKSDQPTKWPWYLQPLEESVGINDLEVYLYIPKVGSDGVRMDENLPGIPFQIKVTKPTPSFWEKLGDFLETTQGIILAIAGVIAAVIGAATGIFKAVEYIVSKRKKEDSGEKPQLFE